MWNPRTQTPLLRYDVHDSYILSLAWSHDGSHIASGDTAGHVHVWHTLTGQHLLTYTGHKRFVRSLAWSPDDQDIASGGDYGDGTVQVWDATTGMHLATWNGQNRIFAVSWSPYSPSTLVSASFDATVQVLQLEQSGQPEQQTLIPHLIYRGHRSPVYAASYSPDGQYVASGGDDTTVQVWEAATGRLVTHYGSHTLAVKALSWSPDSLTIASGGDDKTMHIWNALTGERIAPETRYDAWIRAIAWSPDGKYIALASGTIVYVYRG